MHKQRMPWPFRQRMQHPAAHAHRVAFRTRHWLELRPVNRHRTLPPAHRANHPTIANTGTPPAPYPQELTRVRKKRFGLRGVDIFSVKQPEGKRMHKQRMPWPFRQRGQHPAAHAHRVAFRARHWFGLRFVNRRRTLPPAHRANHPTIAYTGTPLAPYPQGLTRGPQEKVRVARCQCFLCKTTRGGGVRGCTNSGCLGRFVGGGSALALVLIGRNHPAVLAPGCLPDPYPRSPPDTARAARRGGEAAVGG